VIEIRSANDKRHQPKGAVVAEEKSAFPNGRPHHVGLVVRDIEKAIAQLEALGFGPFKFDDEHKVFAIDFEGELHGKPAKWTTKISNALMGDVELELLEPSQGDQALKETLDAQGEGLHHIGWLTTDLQGQIAIAKDRGAKVWTSSFPTGNPGFCYFEGTEIGNLAIELREP
jgi:catechol 2,3-dioxygenase-like lactoylglutathione lyase family enzyme